MTKESDSEQRLIQPVRGTKDLLGADEQLHRYVIDTAERVAACYEFEGISTPIFEYTHIFQRSLGETSDIVGKEMYTFKDRGGELITLRPEGTAAVCRAVISNGLTQSLPLKFIYSGPMLRYERPQKGRLRQFHQAGVECLGPSVPIADVEVIAMGYQILKELGLADDVTLQLNSLGDKESRANYRTALVEYFSKYTSNLSEDSQRRLQDNPLRILDSKEPQDAEIVNNAPLLSEFLNTESSEYYQQVKAGLDALGVPYQHNDHLVRGLDYYNHTAFEFVTDKLGAQGAVLAGGRYNGLVEELGGPDIPAVGWALGIERLALMIDQVPSKPRAIAFVPVGEEAQSWAVPIIAKLRNAGVHVHYAYSGNMAKRMKKANKSGAWLAVIVGEDELKASKATVRDLDTGEQEQVEFARLEEFLSSSKAP